MTAIIYKEFKLPTQSGKANAKLWILEFISKNNRFQEQVMGWTGSTCMYINEVKLRFKSKERAVKFAESKNLEYVVSDSKEEEYVVKSYIDNYL